MSRAAVFSGLLALGSIGPAFAQGAGTKPAQPAAAPAAGKDAAVKLYKEAEAKFDKGDYAGALPLYRQADATSPSPAPKYKIAVCLDKGGQVIEAVAAYQAFLDQKPDAEKFKDKIPEAQKRLEALKKTPAKIKVVTVPEAPPFLQIAVDGVVQPSRELTLTPGRHQLALKADGFHPAGQEVIVSFAETRDVSVALTAAPPPAPPPAPIVAPPPPAPAPEAPAAEAPPAPPPREPSSPVPAYITLGAAGVGLVVGTIFGIMALGDQTKAEEEMTPENLDALERDATIADLGFACAVGFGVTGTVLLLNSMPSDPPPPKAGLVRPRNRMFVAPYVGPTGGGAAARFTF